MAAFASTDVTVVVTDRKVIGTKKIVTGTIAFGDGALTYGTGGVPLPAITSFGLIRSLDALEINGSNVVATEFLLRYDKTNHKIALYLYDGASAGKATFEQAAAGFTPAARTYNFTAWGW
jgi:hypothetical protein